MLIKTSDLSLISKLDEQCFNHDAYSLNLLISLNEFHHFFIIRDNKTPVGFLIVNEIDKKEWEIIKIGIIPDFRKKNFAFFALEEWLMKLEKDTRIFLEVNINNQLAIKLYNKLNFKIINLRKYYYKNNDDALIMERII